MLILADDLHKQPFESVHMDDALFNMPKMLETAEALKDDAVPATYGRDSFISVFHPVAEHVYFFPGIESENLDDDAKRVKDGLKFFVSHGYTAYRCPT